MNEDPRPALERLKNAAASRRLAELCERSGVSLLTVFGSVLDPSVEKPEDLDVAVAARHGQELELLGLIDGLIELAGTSRIDVMVIDHADPVARTHALVGVLVLHEEEEGLFFRTQLRALSERMDTAWLRDIERSKLAS